VKHLRDGQQHLMSSSKAL